LEFFSPKSYKFSNAPSFGGQAFGELMHKKNQCLIPPSPVEEYNDKTHEHYKVIPQIHSLLGDCQPFAASLMDLHETNAGLAAQMLCTAADEIKSAPSLVSAIFCHLLLLSFPITHPLVTCLVTHMQKISLPFCAHCKMEIEDYASFLREHQPDALPPTFPNKHETERFKDNENISELVKINQLGTANFPLLRYDTKLLQSTFTSQATECNGPTLQMQELGKCFLQGSIAHKAMFVHRVIVTSNLCQMFTYFFRMPLLMEGYPALPQQPKAL
jgi:hypothetical protein